MCLLVAFCTYHSIALWAFNNGFTFTCTNDNRTFWIWAPFEIRIFMDLNIPRKGQILFKNDIADILFDKIHSE